MSDNPLVVPCPKGVWTMVAENTQSATIHKLSLEPSVYKQTYRISGRTAPTDDLDAIKIFETATSHVFSHSPGIDVYIKAIGNDGKIRLDA